MVALDSWRVQRVPPSGIVHLLAYQSSTICNEVQHLPHPEASNLATAYQATATASMGRQPVKFEQRRISVKEMLVQGSVADVSALS